MVVWLSGDTLVSVDVVALLETQLAVLNYVQASKPSPYLISHPG